MNNVKEYNSLPSIQLVENRGWTTTSLNGEKTYVPADWTTPRMKDLVSFHRGNGIPKGAVAEDGTYPCVLYGQLFTTYGRTIFKAVSKTSSPGTVEGMVGDVLVPSSTTTTGEDLACASALLISGVFIGSDINILRPKTDLDSTWLARKITSMKREVGSVATGLTIIHVYNKNLAELQLQAPPPAEQTLIAQVLTNQESQVHDLRKLAALERQRLSWLSDELLSGRLRVEEDPTAESVVVSRNEKGEPVEVLPGVRLVENRGWKEVEMNGSKMSIPTCWNKQNIRALFDVSMGTTILSKNTHSQPSPGSIPVYSATEKNVVFGYVDESVIPPSKRLNNGDMVLGARGSLGFPKKVQVTSTSTQTTIQLKTKNTCNTDFALHSLNGKNKQLFGGDGSGVPMLTVRDVAQIEIPLPELNEQSLIAQVLTAQETQASELERLADLEQKRLEWLSDELLSGRIRVRSVDTEDEQENTP